MTASKTVVEDSRFNSLEIQSMRVKSHESSQSSDSQPDSKGDKFVCWPEEEDARREGSGEGFRFRLDIEVNEGSTTSELNHLCCLI